MTEPTNTQTSSNEVELLSFRLGDEEYSVDIMSVREIRGWTRATPLPHAPAYVRGV
ncbi:MAG: chemotaxis protein CheW, partial [Micrococcales bacterium]|nr:chemotaxis protein CheW [Micrococcales bacterium]